LAESAQVTPNRTPSGGRNPAGAVERYKKRAPGIRYIALDQIDEQLKALRFRPWLQIMVVRLMVRMRNMQITVVTGVAGVCVEFAWQQELPDLGLIQLVTRRHSHEAQHAGLRSCSGAKQICPHFSI
jgi:hypothetical protein